MTQEDLKAVEDMLTASYKKSKTQQSGEIYFFIVSVGTYKWEIKLDHTHHEADVFFKIFSQHIEIKRKNIYSLFDENATKVNIISHLRNFKTLLNEDDQLIVYFAGHGHNNDLSNFFVPYDGRRNNFISCIPNQFIKKSLSACSSKSILFCLDFAVDNYTFPLDNEVGNESYSTQIAESLKTYTSKTEVARRFFDYIATTEWGRIKELFLFREYHTQPTAVAALKPSRSISDTWQMSRVLLSRFYELLDDVEHNKTLRVLNYLRVILQNNDENLLERVELLKAKLQEIDRSASIAPSEAVNEKGIINSITCEVVKQIKQNGFYLIYSPKIEKSIKDRVKRRTKILFTSANPRNANFLRLKTEAESIEYELLKSRYRDEFDFRKVPSLDISQLQDSLLNDPPNILHFSGHGTCEGIAVLNDEDEVAIVKSEPLGQLFKLFSDDLQCIFLNSCHSVAQSGEISKYVDNVICMNKEVADEAAILFASKFYKSIGAGKDIKFSFNFAINSIELYNIPGSDIPVLLQGKSR